MMAWLFRLFFPDPKVEAPPKLSERERLIRVCASGRRGCLADRQRLRDLTNRQLKQELGRAR